MSTVAHADNARVAGQLHEAARLLHAQGASPYRVNAYRKAGDAIACLHRDVRNLFQAEGVRGLDAIPGVGLGIATAISEMLGTGRWAMLETLRGTHEPREVRLRAPEGSQPSVETILDVDREDRDRAGGDSLKRIAPRRFNPTHEAWLPILHTSRGPWHFTALHSNTALAHRLGRTRDWVVMFFYDGDHVERQCTVVTETRGSLAGRRVVRGRERECRARYERIEAPQGIST